MPASPFIADAAHRGRPPHPQAPVQPAARVAVAVLQTRLGQALACAMERFDADVQDMVAARGRAKSFASAATLVDIRAFGWKALERYGDEALVLLDSGPSPALRFNDAEVVRLLDLMSDHLTALYTSAAQCTRETARVIGMGPLLSGLEDELFATRVCCGGRLASAVSARRAAPEARASRGAFEWLRATARRLVRRLADGGVRS